jgi:hypothetical protein
MNMYKITGFILAFILGFISMEKYIEKQNNKEVPVTTTQEATVTEAFYTLEKMYDAIRFVESTDGQRTFGENGEIGDYQLKKIYVDDVNRIQRLRGYEGEEPYMSYEDRYDTAKSRWATAIVTSHYANATWKDKPHTAKQYIETAARSHHRPADRNNSKTDAYWEKVKTRMEGVK